jgi:arylsulfatase A-like enzyme
VVVISVDTLRADRLEVYGYDRLTSPNIASLARRSVVFESAQAQSSQTAPSHASLFTSEYAGAHGIVNVHGHSTAMPTLPAGVVTVAELVRSQGVETAAFVSGGNLTRGMDMHRGFDVWDERNEDVAGRVRALVDWMAAPGRGRFVALLHSYQVHAPYVPPAEQAARFADPSYAGPLRARYESYLALAPGDAWAGGVGSDYWAGMLEYSEADVRFLSDLYDAEIAYTDAALRPLLELLLTGERSRDTAVFLLSDHGEEFMDHGKYQHDQVYEELLHVPLLIRLPGGLAQAGWKGRASLPVELVDVAPTIVELMGLELGPTRWSGRSLVDAMRPSGLASEAPGGAAAGPGAGVDRARFSELVVGPGPKRYRTVTWRGWKYIHAFQADLGAEWEWLFDLDADPGERTNRIRAGDPESAGMHRLLRERLDEHTRACEERAMVVGGAGSAEVSAESREQLEQLGY